MSTRFASGRIGSVYLTSTGLIGGTPCKVIVEDESIFASSYFSNSVAAADGTPHTQVINTGVKGREFGIKLEWCPEALLASIVAALTAALASLSSVRVVIDSQTDFDVMAVPVMQNGKLFSYESRSGGIAKNVSFRFISTGPGA